MKKVGERMNQKRLPLIRLRSARRLILHFLFYDSEYTSLAFETLKYDYDFTYPVFLLHFFDETIPVFKKKVYHYDITNYEQVNKYVKCEVKYRYC